MGSTATRIVIVHKQSGLRDSNGNSLSPRLNNMDQGTQPGSSLLSLQRSSLVYNQQSKSKLKTIRSKTHAEGGAPQTNRVLVSKTTA